MRLVAEECKRKIQTADALITLITLKILGVNEFINFIGKQNHAFSSVRIRIHRIVEFSELKKNSCCCWSSLLQPTRSKKLNPM
jgi:hypothetical protein